MKLKIKKKICSQQLLKLMRWLINFVVKRTIIKNVYKKTLKNNDFSKLIHQAENTFRLRVNQV